MSTVLTDLLIRPARLGDRPQIVDIVGHMGFHEDVLTRADAMRYLGSVLSSPETRGLVAVLGDRTVGYAELHARPSSIGDYQQAWLAIMAVDERVRGSGIGARLQAAVEHEARMLGCAEIALESSMQRNAAHAFYRAQGYAEHRPAMRFRKSLESSQSAPVESIEERFLYAAGAAASAVRVAIAGLAAERAVGMGADGAPTEAADDAAERAALAHLHPLELPIISEECGLVGPMPGASDYWISLDPLDGTRNFRAGFPPWATSIGLVKEGAAVAGLVVDLWSGRRWWARAGGGAWVDGRPARPNAGVLYATPSPQPSMPSARLPAAAKRLRISGCTSVELCRIADGTLAGFDARRRGIVHVHDLAAAAAILSEAGACVLTLTGEIPKLIPDPEPLLHIVAGADEATAQELLDEEL
ncbi:MAG: GNAT family N-acetyltransferase [Candidatus Eremiobacteraeota bacterium]|nr:GNAT family N-acetyltransferase [Candidatus Eremiobacteraeota bacterium]MBV8223081.1 GNAT family N-acetyltransferase [Candidatus Eremiobacteraeota bacterium]